jgi:hypothetical protein
MVTSQRRRRLDYPRSFLDGTAILRQTEYTLAEADVWAAKVA